MKRIAIPAAQPSAPHRIEENFMKAPLTCSIIRLLHRGNNVFLEPLLRWHTACFRFLDKA